MKNLRSFKIVSSEDGGLEFVLIAHKGWTVSRLNGLIRNVMKCTVIDERSEMVNKEYVD